MSKPIEIKHKYKPSILIPPVAIQDYVSIYHENGGWTGITIDGKKVKVTKMKEVNIISDEGAIAYKKIYNGGLSTTALRYWHDNLQFGLNSLIFVQLELELINDNTKSIPTKTD